MSKSSSSRKKALGDLAQKAVTVDGQLELVKEIDEAFKNAEHRKCIQLCTILIDANADNPKANYFVQRARASLELKRLNDVFADTDRALRLQPTNSKAYALQGYAHYQTAELLKRQHSLSTQERTQKVQLRVRSAQAAMTRARELEPSLASNEIFRKHWEECERERVILEGTPEQEAPPFLAALSGALGGQAMDRTIQREARGDEAALAKIHVTGQLVPNAEDSVLLKSEVLFFVTSLNRGAFSVVRVFFLDTVKDVRNIHEYRNSLLSAEQKVSYDAQVRGWQLDRQTWISGTRQASSVGELLVCIRSLYSSMKPQAIESRPDQLADQISSIVKDLEAFGDENLGSAHVGECRELRLALINRCLRMLPMDHGSSLKLFKARILADEGCWRDAVEVVNEIVEAYNLGFCARGDLEEAISVRAEAISVLESTGSANGLKITPPHTNGENRVLMSSLGAIQPKAAHAPDPNISSRDGSVSSMFQLWQQLPEATRKECLIIPVSALEPKLPGVAMRRLTEVLNGIGSKLDLLDSYRNPRLAESSGWSHFEPLSPEGETSIVAGLSANIQDIYKAERAFWSDFERDLDELRISTLLFEEFVPQEHPEQKPVHVFAPYVKPAPCLSCDASLGEPESQTEAKVLAERERIPESFSHQAVTGGWNKRIKPPYSTVFRGLDADAHDVPAQLLTEETFFVILDRKDPFHGGIFVPELCARVCHSGRPSVYIGRCPMRSECGANCCLGPDAVQTGPKVERSGKAALSILAEPESELASFLRVRPSALLVALVDSLSKSDDEETLVRWYQMALDEAREAEAVLRKYERRKWGLEQMRQGLIWTLPALRLLTARYDDRQLRDVEEFIAASASLRRAILAVPQGLRLGQDPLNRALSICEELFAERTAARDTLAGAQSQLAMEEEKLSALSPGSFPGGVFDMHAMQQILNGEEFARQQSVVVIANQKAVLCQTRLSETETLLSVSCLGAYKRFHSELRGFAVDALARLKPSELAHICEEVVVSDLDKGVIERVRDDDDEHLGQLSPDSAYSIGKRAAEALRNYPRTAEDLLAMTEVDAAWERLCGNMERVLRFMASAHHELASGKPLAPDVSVGLSFGHKILDEVDQSMQRPSQTLAELAMRERWRRAELMRYIHLRNQALYQAMAEVVREQIQELQLGEERARLVRELMDEESKAKRKAEEKKRKKQQHASPNGVLAKQQSTNGHPAADPAADQIREAGKSPEPTQSAALEKLQAVSIANARASVAQADSNGGKAHSPVQALPIADGRESAEGDSEEWTVVGTSKRKDALSAKQAAKGPQRGTFEKSRLTAPTDGKAPVRGPNSNPHSKRDSTKGQRTDAGATKGRGESLKPAKLVAETLNGSAMGLPSAASPEPTHPVVSSVAVEPSVDAGQASPAHADSPPQEHPSVQRAASEVSLDSAAPARAEATAIEFGDSDSDEPDGNEPRGDSAEFSYPGEVPMVRVMTPVGEIAVPRSFICPLTNQIMVNPVKAADGHDYEQMAMVRWLSTSRVSPVTNIPLANDILTPNLGLRAMIQETMMRAANRPMPFPPAPPLPGHLQPRVCAYFQQGMCRYGPGCRNLHVLPPTAPFPVFPGAPRPVFAPGPHAI